MTVCLTKVTHSQEANDQNNCNIDDIHNREENCFHKVNLQTAHRIS